MAFVRYAVVKVCIVAMMFAASILALAQAPSQTDINIDPATRAELIESVIKQLHDQYIFPETAKQIEKANDKLRNAIRLSKLSS